MMRPIALTLLLSVGISALAAADIDSTLDTITLDEAIELAIENSVSSKVAENQKLAAYWRYNSYKANMLPEISFTGTLPSYSQNYVTYQREDGSYTFIKSNNLELLGGLQVVQNIPLTGGTITLESSLDFMRQIGNLTTNEFMSVPLELTLVQSLFSVNTLRWLKRIEPLRYEESERSYNEDMIDVSLSALAKFFNTLLYESKLAMAQENLITSEELYRVAQARRKIGEISERDLSQLELQALQAKATLIEAESNFRAQMFQLRAFLAIPESQELSITTPSETPSGRLDYHRVLGYAMENSTFAKSVIRRSLESEYSVATAKGNRRQIDLYASFGYAGVGDELQDSYINNTTNHVVEFGVSVPIIDWGRRKADVKVAESNHEVVEAQIAEEKISFNQDIFLLVENYNNQASQFEISAMAERIAAKNYNTTFQTFLSGDSDILTLNDARERRDAAQQKYIEQMYMYWSYYYQIERVCLEKMEVLIGVTR